MKYYAQINSHNNLVNIGLDNISEDEYGSSDVLNITVSEEIYNNARQYGDNYYIYSDGNIIVNPDFEEELAQNREKEFKKQFFETSLGWVRRKVTMKDGSTSIFLTDLLPLLSEGIPVLIYETPDFRGDFDIVDYQKQKLTTEQFLKECKNQLIIDFYGFNPVKANGEEVEPNTGESSNVE